MNVISKTFFVIMELIQSTFGGIQYDPEGTHSDSSGKDLGINIFLRSNILDENRRYIGDVNSISSLVSVVESANKVTADVAGSFLDVTWTPMAWGVLGLDSMSVFEPMNVLSSQTLQNHFQWDYLIVDFNFTIKINSLGIETDEIKITIPPIVEKSNIKFGIDNIDAIISFLLALDIDLIRALQIINILDTSHFAPCLRLINHQIQLTQLQIIADSILSSKLKNFIAEGVENLASNLYTAVVDLYGVAFQTIPPNFVSTMARSKC